MQVSTLKRPREEKKEVDREKEIFAQRTNLPVDLRGDPPPSIIRPEINFLNFPFFALSRRGLKDKTKTECRFIEERNGQKVELLWRVISTAEYGYPAPFDRRVSRAVDALIQETLERTGYPLKNPLPFSIYRLAELMGLNPRGGKVYRDIKVALLRIKFTGVESKGSFFLKEKKRWIHDAFSLYDRVLFRGQDMEDGTMAESNYVWLNSFYLRNINQQYVRPLDYNYLAGLKKDIASRLYELLSGRFFGLPRSKKHYQVNYISLCEFLPITPQRYISKAIEKMKPAHDELIATGFLSRVVFRKGKKDFVVVYYLGKRAERERRGGLAKQIAELATERDASHPPLDTPDTIIQLSELAKELHDRDISQSVSMRLAKNYSEYHIREKIKIFDFFMKADDGTITDNPAGWLITAIKNDIKPTKKQERAGRTARKEKASEQIHTLKLEREKIKESYSEQREKIYAKLINEHEKAVREALWGASTINSYLTESYKPEEPFAEQSLMLQANAKMKLKKQFPDLFKATDEEEEKHTDKIDEQIKALEAHARSKIL